MADFEVSSLRIEVDVGGTKIETLALAVDDRELATVINMVDLDLMVLGGGMSNLERPYRTVPKLWSPYVFSNDVDIRSCPHKSRGCGAARLWPAKIPA